MKRMEMKTIDRAKGRVKVWRGRIAARIDEIPMRRMAVCAGILFALSLLPLLALGRYNVMCIDDYDYGRQIHDTWLATGSLVQSIRTAWQQNMEFYRDWQGTYISCFLMGLCPMNFDYSVAWIVPILMIGMFAVSAFLLGRHILCRWLGADRDSAAFVMFVLLFLFYQVLEAPFEGIYWYNGATHYILMESVWFFTLTAISSALWAERRSGEILLSAVAAVLAVIVGGGNLITGLQAEIVMALLVLYAVVTNRKKIAVAAIPFLTGSMGFLINVMAPGNVRRGELDTDVGYAALLSILLSFYYAGVFIIRWTTVFVILVWFLLLPVLWKLAKRSDRKFDHPVLVTFGCLCLLAAMFTPTLYAVGMVGLSRVDNIIQMVYYLCLVMVTTYWLGYISHRERAAAFGAESGEGERRISGTREERAGDVFGRFLEAAGMKMTVVCLFLTLIVWIFTADKNTYTSVSALRSLAKGEGRTFYAEAMERHALYVDDAVTGVEVTPYSVRPALFDFNDLSEDEGNWINLAVARYYHKEYVRCLKR